jgi:hypothetical protein
MMAAQYRCLADLYLPGCQYAQAGDIISDQPSAGTIPIPVGFIPPLAVDPLTQDAINSFWLAGPKGLNDGEPNRQTYIVSRWSGKAYSPPVIYWTRYDATSFILTGAGKSLGPYPQDITKLTLGTPHAVQAVKDVAPAVAVEREEDWWRALIKEDDAFSVNELVPALFRLTTAITWDQFRYEAGTVVSNKPPLRDKRPWWLQGPPVRYLPGLNHLTMPPGLVPLNTQAKSMHRRSKYAGEQVSATISGAESIG